MTTTDKTKALLAAATEGPWRECGRDRGGCVCCLVWSIPDDHPIMHTDSRDPAGEGAIGSDRDKANAALIAHLRNVAEHYVAVAECLREVIARVDAEAANGEEWVQSPEDAALEKRAREALRALGAAGGGDG